MTAERKSALLTYAIAAGSSLLFCSKGVFAKLAYAQGADTITVLVLRMAIAFPCFAIAAAIASHNNTRLTARQWLHLAALGFIGYYLSSFVNFYGLTFITVGLERIVLFSYPALVLVGAAVFKKQPVTRASIASVAVAYTGIIIAFAGEASGRGDTTGTLLGVALIFASALSYAVFVSIGADLVHTVGATRFTSITVGFSCLYMMLHYAAVHPVTDILTLPKTVYAHGATLAVFGTILPSFLMGIGIKRAGAQRFAVIGTVGPVATVVLAWIVLDESLNPAQLAGLALSLAGGIAISLTKAKPTR